MTAPAPTELLPCPFCGGEADLSFEHGSHPDWWKVTCTGCGCRTISNTTDRQKAIDSWNTRQAASVERTEQRALELLEEAPAAALRALVMEECAKILDDAAQDWRRIRDPGMANNAAAYAKKIRALAIPSADREGK